MKIVVEEVPFYFRFVDYLMIPIMWALAGFKMESPQESHKWHIQKINNIKITDNKSVAVIGDDKSRFDNKTLLIHIPVLGGWKNYVVLKAENYKNYWFVGWKVKFLNENRQDYCEVQKLRIHSQYIKVLKGISDSQKIFFGVDSEGKPIKLKNVGEGTLGDGKYKNVRLF